MYTKLEKAKGRDRQRQTERDRDRQREREGGRRRREKFSIYGGSVETECSVTPEEREQMTSFIDIQSLVPVLCETCLYLLPLSFVRHSYIFSFCLNIIH